MVRSAFTGPDVIGIPLGELRCAWPAYPEEVHRRPHAFRKSIKVEEEAEVIYMPTAEVEAVEAGIPIPYRGMPEGALPPAPAEREFDYAA